MMTEAAIFSLLSEKTLAEIVGHGRRIQLLRDNARAPAEHRPGKKRTDDRVADSDPCRRNAEIPAELPRITDKNDGGKI